MIDKNTYTKLKNEIRCYPCNYVLELCDSMKLNNDERQLLMDFYNKKKVVHTCMEIGMSTMTYTRHLKEILTKYYNYKNTFK